MDLPDRTAVATAQERLLRQHDEVRRFATLKPYKERNVLSIGAAVATDVLIFLSRFLA